MINRLISVHGLPGSGKTTLIENQFQNYIKMVEPIDQWQILVDGEPIFEKYYKILQKKDSLTQDEQDVVISFQFIVMLSRLQQYQQLQQDKKYIFERSIQEDYEIFCKTQYNLLDTEHIYALKLISMRCIEKEPIFDLNIYLKLPITQLMERIQRRNRHGERVDIKYMYQLSNQYNNFMQQDHYPKEYALCLELEDTTLLVKCIQRKYIDDKLPEYQKWILKQLQSHNLFN